MAQSAAPPTVVAPPPPPPAASLPASAVEEHLYEQALADYQRGNYEAAVVNFKQFLRQAPKAAQAGNAQYLVGEALYAQKQYEAAIIAFDQVILKYPEDNKVPTALLKQGFAFAALKDLRNARFFLQQVQRKYPASAEAQQAAEKLRALSASAGGVPPPLLTTKPTSPAATSPRAGAAPEAFAFPPRQLEKKRSKWLKALADGTSDAPLGSPEMAAWQIGAWWAIVDWCAERGRTCEVDAAEYVQQVMGTDPRSLNDCGWAHAIGGVLGDGYDVTSTILYEEARTPVRLDHLFERHEVKLCPE